MGTAEIKAESSHSRCAYDVFLSFRGDTRKAFTDHLYHSLRKAGFETFRDEEEVRKGETLSSELRRAIRSSRISIIVFSKGYASSRWCLDELVEMLECMETRKQVVLPVFYDVGPSEVRKQIGEFGEALDRREERFGEEKVKSWRDALMKVGELTGWELQQVANGYETKLIDAIIKKVSSIVKRVPMFVAKHTVGLGSRVKDIVRLMCKDFGDDVRLIGIYGMGGIGKTTLVKAVYNDIFEYFDSSCFLEIRSSVVDQHNNKIIALQQELLRKLLSRKIKFSNVDEGIMWIKKMLGSRKSLIVLDDLDDLDQLEALAGERNWFGAGSTIILTTRDKHILKDLKVEERYRVKELNEEDSLQLFSLHTFKLSKPPKDYTKISEDIVSYCGGLPLALQLLGAHLSDKQKEDWRSALERLKKIPSNKVHEKLKISFDGLPSKFTKDVFLDLACCFPEVIHKKIAISILEVPGYFIDIEIQDLIDKSLISIDKYDYLTMHSLIQEMGREIARSESPCNPGEQRRLCCPNEIREVLLNHTGTAKVEGIVVYEPMQDMSVDTKAFKNMTNLRLLRLNHLQLHGSFKYLSRKLRWLELKYCHSKYIPSAFRSENLVILSIENSNIKEFQAPLKNFLSMKYWRPPLPTSLRILRARLCESLQKLPNLSNLKCLKELDLFGCKKLVEVDGLENLDSIEMISLMNCNRVRIPFTEGFFKRQAELRCHPLKDLKLKVAYSDNEFPSWFTFQEVGSSISFQIPSLHKRHDNELKFLVLILLLVWEPTSQYRHYLESDLLNNCNNNGTHHMGCMLLPNGPTSSTCYLTLDSLASIGMLDKTEMKSGRNMKIDVVDVNEAILVKKVGVHALYVSNADFEGDDLIDEKISYLDIKIYVR